MLTAEKLQVEVGETGVDETARKLNRLGDDAGDGKSSGWAGKLAMAGAAAFAAVGAGAVAVAGYGLKIAAGNEQAAIAFTTLLGPAADDFMKQVQDFAAKTPFEFPELRDAASRLLAVGTATGEVIPLMTTLGDATSAMGTGSEGISRAVTALTQMQQKGKVTAEEMLQLTEAGIPAWDALASVLGTDVADAQAKVTARQVDANAMFQALETSAGPALQRVKGMMDAQSASLTGMLSTLKDTAGQGLASALAPAVDAIKGQLPGLTSIIQSTLASVGPQLGGLLTQVVAFAGQLLPVLAPVLGVIADVAQHLLAALGPALTALAPHLSMVAGLLGGTLAQALDTLAPVLPQIAGALGDVAAVLAGQLDDLVGGLVPLLVQLVQAALPLVPALGELAQTLISSLLPAILPLLPPIVDLTKTLVGTADAQGPLLLLINLLDSVLKAIPPEAWRVMTFTLLMLSGGIIELSMVAKGLMAAWGPVSRFFIMLWDKVSGAFSAGLGIVQDVVGFFVDLPGNITGALTDMAAAAPGLIASVFDALVSGAETGLGLVLGFFTDLPRNAGLAIGMGLGLLVLAGVAVVKAIVEGHIAAAQLLWSFFTELPGRILALITGALSWLTTTGVDIVTGLLSGLWQADVAVGQFFLDLPGRIAGFLVDAASWLLSTGVSVVTGLWDGLVSMDVWLGQQMLALPGWITGALGDAGTWLWQVAVDLVVGLWHGIQSMGGWLMDQVKGLAGGIVDGFKSALHIGSPSRVMMELGSFIGQGLAQGIAGSAGLVGQAADRLALAAVPALGAAVAPYPGTASTAAARGTAAAGGGATVPVTLVLDGQVLARVLIDPLRGEVVDLGERTKTSVFGGYA